MRKILATILVFVGVIVAGIFLIRINQQETDVTKTQTKVGFLLNGRLDDHSWGESHYNGMEISARKLNLDVVYKEDVPEDETCTETIESLIADGCEIHGTVENSIIFRGVKIGKGAVVRNSIILQDTYVGSDVSLNCVITDKNVVINDGRVLSGHQTMPFFIGKGVRV